MRSGRAALSVFAAALSFAAAQPAVAQTRQRDALIREATAAREAQDFARAIRLLESARADHPDDPEILRLLGTNYAFAKRYDEAIATLSHARDVAPGDLDIRLALTRAYLWAGRPSEAESELRGVEARDQGNAEAAALRRQIDATATNAVPSSELRRGGVALWSSISDVSLASGDDRTWWTAGASIYGTVAPRTTLTAQVEREARGRGLIDTYLLARVDHGFSPSLRAYLAVAGTPNADFREHWSLRGGIEGDVGGSVTLLLDARHADYGHTNVTALEPGARLAIGPLRGSATIRMINLWDETNHYRSGWSGRLDSELGNGMSLFGGAATYPDTQAGVTRRLHAAFAGVQFPIGDRWSLRLTGDYEKRRQSYERKGATVGLQMRF